MKTVIITLISLLIVPGCNSTATMEMPGVTLDREIEQHQPRVDNRRTMRVRIYPEGFTFPEEEKPKEEKPERKGWFR